MCPAQHRTPHRHTARLTAAEAIRRWEVALTDRARLLADPHTTACRVFNAAADGITGLVIEKLADVLVVQFHEERLALSEDTARELCQRAMQQLDTKAAYRKVFPRDRAAGQRQLDQMHADPTPWIGSPTEPEFPVLEHGLRFLVRPYDGFATGLFLEHRANRARLRQLAAGRHVLNAFAYTCGFTVAAAIGGAATTVSLDISKKSLEWGRHNLAANSIPPDDHTFICSDVFDYYRRARRQGRSFDVIILDPPTFARTKRPKQTFTLTADLPRLVAGAVELLAPGGYLLLSTNHRPTSHRRLLAEITAAAAARGRQHELIARPRLPADFRGDPHYAKSILVRVD